jgi:cytochrome c-type biogenesis protein
VAGTDLTFAVAVGAGLLSFVSPCVLPLVPAYLGQLTMVAVASSGDRATPSRTTAIRFALAYVLGFGAVFTILGVTATFAARGLAGSMDDLRRIGGILLIILGLSTTGLIRIPVLERTWRPLDAGASAGLATSTGGLALAPAGGGGLANRLGSRLVTGRAGLATALGMGAVFAIGWTPCIGTILGGILGLASREPSAMAGGLLLIGYSLGLGLPFIAVAAFYDRAQPILRPLVRHGRAVSIVGGLLVVAIGVLMTFDLLTLIVQLVPFNRGV